MTEWDIQSRSDKCAICQRPFADKEPYHTSLSLSPAGYQRLDLCATCHISAPREGVLSYWQGEYKLPTPPEPEVIQKETAETLLRKLVESTDPNHTAARYILAVMLERKRILKHRDTTRGEDGADLLIYEHARSGESFTIPDPHLRLDELAQVQQEVTTLLNPTAANIKAEPVAESSPDA